MQWTRSPWMRLIALAAGVALVVTHAGERDLLFWMGVVIVVLNLLGLAASSLVREPGSAARDPRPPVEEAPEELTLAELLAVPGVAAALAAGPREWQQVSYLEESFGPMTAAELAPYVWVGRDEDGWALSLGDEVKPYVDLDVDEDDDAVIRVLLAHPRVTDAYHEDREVYLVQTSEPLGVEEFAVLAAQALVAHHEQAAARLG